ncbi:CP4-57 prophage; integrase [Haemophilus parahaemolyticus]|uniref:CP4-57 prophage integrase n=1 Tax=Haemophilus parahaemolyticus TaxID=735 RepID=A0A377I3M6_HAEPH|nr:integrase [Haemophilus parahaemolyticus]STO64577.1 CP4-57 prophage; integrase [Haemophilus parahaemolyticus]
MSSETVNRVLNRNGYKDILTAHGIRSIVRTYLAKQNVERNTAEAVLSHKIKDRLERTYNRSDYFEERIPVCKCGRITLPNVAGVALYSF